MIKMTRQQYQNTYGQAPSVSSQPIKMTRQEYSQKYGSGVEEPKTLGGFAGNVVKSGGRAVGGVVSSAVNVLNPNADKNTLVGMGRLASGAAQLLDPTEGNKIAKEIPGIGLFGNNEQTARNVGSFYNQRYGGLDKIGNTLYNDPIGVAMDVSTVAGGVGALARGAGFAKLGSGLSRVSGALDPISLASRGVGAVGRGSLKATGGALDDVGSFLMRKSSKASPSQRADFLESSKMPIEDFLYENRITDGATGAGIKQMENLVSPFQESYNKLTRTGRNISRKEYASAILDQAVELEAKFSDPATRKIIKSLLDEAELQWNTPNSFSDIQLTDTKSKAFDNSSKAALSDYNASSFNEQLGRSGQTAIERIAPGSKALGQKLRPIRGAQEILRKQTELGKGGQIVGVLKAPFAGAVSGAALGSFVPGLGNATGALLGGAVSTVLNNPQFQGRLGTALKDISRNKLPQVKVPYGGAIYGSVKAGRLANPNQQEDQQQLQPKRKPKSQVQSYSEIIPQPKNPALKARNFSTNTSSNVFKNRGAFGGTKKLTTGSY